MLEAGGQTREVAEQTQLGLHVAEIDQIDRESEAAIFRKFELT